MYAICAKRQGKKRKNAHDRHPEKESFCRQNPCYCLRWQRRNDSVRQYTIKNKLIDSIKSDPRYFQTQVHSRILYFHQIVYREHKKGKTPYQKLHIVVQYGHQQNPKQISNDIRIRKIRRAFFPPILGDTGAEEQKRYGARIYFFKGDP